MSNKVPKSSPSMRTTAVQRAEAARAAQAAAEQKRTRMIVVGVVIAVLVVGGALAALVMANKGEETASATPGPVMREYSCQSCHAVTPDPTGTQSMAPSWAGLYGSEVTLEDGATVTADDAYLRRAILDPRSELVAGYGPTMPERAIPDEDVEALIAEIRALADEG